MGMIIMGYASKCSIKNCVTCDSLEFKCNMCRKNFIIAENGSCQREHPQKCIEINGSCKNCVSGYYSWNGHCLKQQIANCLSYMSNQNMCQLCRSLFYLNSGVCSLINDWNKCLSSDGHQNKCLMFKKNTLFKIARQLSNTSTDPNCILNNSANNCGLCKKLYYVDTTNNNLCTPITISSQCFWSDGVNNSCLICNSLFYFSGGQCYPFSDLNCASSDGLSIT